MKVVLFNGPPSSGKDTISDAVYRSLFAGNQGNHVYRYKFSGCMKNAVSSLFDLHPRDYKKFFETSEKDKPQEKFFGKTPREILISFSENWAKKLYDLEIFGKLAGERLTEIEKTWFKDSEPVFLVSDCGFQEELNGLFKYVKPENCAIFRLHREGATFRNDSRGWIMDYTVRMNKKLDNNRPIDIVVNEVLKDLREIGFIPDADSQ